MRRRDKTQPQKVVLLVALRACSWRQAIETKANFAGADAAEVALADKPKGTIMSERERMMKLLAATPQTLARVDAVLNGTDGRTAKADDDCRLVTYTEAARRLNLSRPTVYRLAKAGRLDVVPLNGVNRIKLQSVFDYVSRITK